MESNIEAQRLTQKECFSQTPVRSSPKGTGTGSSQRRFARLPRMSGRGYLAGSPCTQCPF
eukprot:6496386-Heterocapsa_arctica.AAC.1